MNELYLTLSGLAVAALTAVYSLATDKDKSRIAKTIIAVFTIAGLATGIEGAILQDSSARKAQRQLDDVQTRVGTDGLTALDQLGDARYFVIIDTFQNNDRSNRDFEDVRGRLLVLFPNAEKNGLLWRRPIGKNGAYQLILGKNLTLTSAEVFRRLASYGISNGEPLIRRER